MKPLTPQQRAVLTRVNAVPRSVGTLALTFRRVLVTVGLLESRGYVERSGDRGQLVSVTPAGRELLIRLLEDETRTNLEGAGQ